MMRPATPLAVLNLGAFAAFLLASLSTPVLKAIPLGGFGDYNFGVWGYCNGNDCSQVQIGYTVDGLDSTDTQFTLSTSTRKNVSYVLIVHPVAALLNLVSLAVSIGAHFHGPANSTRYALGMLLLSLPTFLLSLMALLVDILLFMPHIKWGGWIILAGTIMVFLSAILACGVRRTLSSRKDQRKRIAENAEMSGENYYNRQALKATLPRVSSPTSGDSISPYKEKQMGFSSFDVRPIQQSEDRVPLNPALNTSFRSNPYDSERDRFGPDRNGPYTGPYSGPYSNSTPAMNGAMGGAMGGAAMGGVMGGAQMPYRGRGGYGPRGGFPPRGGRGGPGYSPCGYPPGPGMRGPPPPGWNGRGRGGMPRGMMAGPGMGPRRSSPTSYDDSRIISAYYDDAPQQVPQQAPQQAPLDPFNAPKSHTPSPPLEMGDSSPARGPQTGGPGIISPLETRTLPQELPTNQAYVPPRTQWNQRAGAFDNSQPRLSPIQGSPPLDNSRRVSGSLAGYLEDVDPRFEAKRNQPATAQSAVEAPSQYPPIFIPARMSRTPPLSIGHSSSAIDLRTLPMTFRDSALRPPPPPGPSGLEYHASLDSLPLAEGQRSPAHSDGSHFTSVSQRGVNPAWRPGGRRVQQNSRDDIILDNNPDFQLPPGRGGFRGGMRGRGGPGGVPRGGFGSMGGRSGSLPGNMGAGGPYGANSNIGVAVSGPYMDGGGGGAYPMQRGNSNGGRYPLA